MTWTTNHNKAADCGWLVSQPTSQPITTSHYACRPY